jgi:hypothetical protein
MLDKPASSDCALRSLSDLSSSAARALSAFAPQISSDPLECVDQALGRGEIIACQRSPNGGNGICLLVDELPQQRAVKLHVTGHPIESVGDVKPGNFGRRW